MAGSLSDQPELLTKMMGFMDRLETENGALKQER